jgi:mRNA degradation ribonuclease J1/J2
VSEPAVRLIPLGGLGEIGLNMMLVEFGDELIAVDCGLMFPDADEMPGIDYVIPDFSYALAKREGFRAVIFTHGHEDHIGAIPYLLREAPVPVYGTRLTLALVAEKLREHGLADTADLRPIRPRERIELGPFGVEPIRVTHSIVDGIGLAIGTPVGTIVRVLAARVRSCRLRPVGSGQRGGPRVGPRLSAAGAAQAGEAVWASSRAAPASPGSSTAAMRSGRARRPDGAAGA